MASKGIDRDRFMNLPSSAGANATYRLVDAAQSFTPEEQLAAAALFFVSVADLYGADVPDVVQAVRNMIKDPIHGEKPQFRALRLYVQHELKGSR